MQTQHLAQQQLQELRGSPIEHDASLWTPRWADGADLGPVGLNVVGEPVEPLFSNLRSEMFSLHSVSFLSGVPHGAPRALSGGG